jgi:hypothetical protein
MNMPDDNERPHLDRGRGQKAQTEPKAPLQPGEKQPAHNEPQQVREQTLDALRDMQDNMQVETYGPSGDRAKQPGNLNETPPHERLPASGPAITSAAQIAAGHIAAATTAIELQETSDRLLKSDPRYERDQKVFEMGQRGKLGLVPPSEAEQAVMAQRAGISADAADKIPTNAEEQVEEDMQRLNVAEEREQSGVTGTAPSPSGMPIPVGGQNSSPKASSSSGAVRQSPVKPGEQEMGTPPNNLDKARAAGLTIGGAEGRAQEAERKQAEEQGKSDAQGDTVIK